LSVCLFYEVVHTKNNMGPSPPKKKPKINQNNQLYKYK
jgi:hypothetical protein